MKIIIKESSLVHLISVFLDEMEHLDGICHVDVKKRDDGGIHLRATIKKQFFIVFGAGRSVGEIRKYYTDKVSNYFGVPVDLSFEVVNKC